MEILATVGIMLVLAAAILPLARNARRTAKEIRLRNALRLMRDAIDEFHARCDVSIAVGDGVKISKKLGDATCAEPTYPDTLESLVEGLPVLPDGTKKRVLLRRIPDDPMSDDKPDWEMRCYKDGREIDTWCGTDVYDVHSKSTAIGSDGRKYSEW
jgi:general secretion pathway protein G